MERKNPVAMTIKQIERQLKFYNLKTNMILFSKGHPFEFNPITCEIKPLNSFVWYPINQEAFHSLLWVLRGIYDAVTEAKEENPFAETYDSMFANKEILGLLDGNIFGINLDNIMEMITIEDISSIIVDKAENIDEMNDMVEEMFYIVDECKEFIEITSKLYDQWGDAMRFLLNNFDNVGNLMSHTID